MFHLRGWTLQHLQGWWPHFPGVATTPNNMTSPNVNCQLPLIHQQQTQSNNPFQILTEDDDDNDGTVVARNCSPWAPPPTCLPSTPSITIPAPHQIVEDHTDNLYCGINLKWNYTKPYVDSPCLCMSGNNLPGTATLPPWNLNIALSWPIQSPTAKTTKLQLQLMIAHSLTTPVRNVSNELLTVPSTIPRQLILQSSWFYQTSQSNRPLLLKTQWNWLTNLWRCQNVSINN